MSIFHAVFVALSVIVAATLSGCLTGRSPPTTFYTLSATEAPPAKNVPVDFKDPLLIGIGPVDMPAYLDRSQIVSQETAHRLGVDEFHQWAEPLESNFVRVLAVNVANRLPNKKIIRYPWGVTPADLKVIILVTRFSAGADKQVHLDALWGIFKEESDLPMVTKKARITQAVAGDDQEAIVAAMSKAVGEFSREIANGLATLSVRDYEELIEREASGR